MQWVYCALLGYAIGAVNPAWIFGKLHGGDIRTMGSGNAGASNVLIVYGKVFGVLCALLDIGKAWLAIRLANRLWPDFSPALALTGSCCVLGHLFPFYMGFRGGKGLACLGGMILAWNWRLFLLLLGCEILLALVTDYICVVPITVSIVFPVLYWRLGGDPMGLLPLVCMTLAVLYKHVENLQRIRAGTEMRLRYLWRPEQEMARMGVHANPQEDKK